MKVSTDELIALAPLAGGVVQLGEDEDLVQVTVRKLRVDQVPYFTRAIRPIIGDVVGLLDGQTDIGASVLALLDTRSEHVSEALAAATVQFGKGWIDDQKDAALRARRDDIRSATLEQAGELLVAVLALNKDFFHGRLMLALKAAVQLRGAGQTPSPG